MDKKQLIETLEKRYEILINARADYYEAHKAVVDLRTVVKKETAKLYANGKVEGKNQKERDAFVVQKVSEWTDHLEIVEEESALAQLALEIAQDNISCIRETIRIFELVSVEL